VKFSIITPSFNQGSFIKDCIESVLSQDGVSVEHIIVDAGSTDETLSILKEYPHLKWISESDLGMSDGINKGFKKANGEWLMWLNCDDYLLNNSLKKIADFIKLHSSADVIHGDCIFVNKNKSIIRRKYDHPVDEFMLLFVGCYIPSTSTFIRRTIVESGHLLNIDYRVCMDWEYYLRLIRRGYKFYYIPEAIAGFRWHDSNTSVLQVSRRIEETFMLQSEHIKLQSMPYLLNSKYVLKILRRIFQLIRIMRRRSIHKRFF
jgi:glycosyltransferase involved in cell wall biosynthesis